MTAFPSEFLINVIDGDEQLVRVCVEGELDMATSPKLDEALKRELGARRKVVLDLSGVTFMDSTGLNTIMSASRSSRADRLVFTISPTLPTQVLRVLEITGLRDALPIAAE